MVRSFRFSLHLARTLKKLLIILLLIIFADQTAKYLFVNTEEISFVLEVDETEDKGGEEKSVKESLVLTSVTKWNFSVTRTFPCQPCRAHTSPLVDHISPPPDAIL